LKLAKYIAILVAGIGIGVIGLLVLGYEKPIEKQPVRLIKPVESKPPIVYELPRDDEELKKANRKLDRKVDELADSLLSLKARVDSLNFIDDTNSTLVSKMELELDSFIIQGEDFVVERDQLLSAQTLKIEWLDTEVVADTSGLLVDSLKLNLNIQPDERQEFLKVEIWKSPLNFTGYKLSKTKLVVYGMINELILNVSSRDEKIFIKTNLATYVLSQTSNFRDLVVL